MRAIYQRLEPARLRLAQRDDELLALQIAIAAVPAPTGDEGARAAFVASRLAGALPNVGIDAAGKRRGAPAGDTRRTATGRALRPPRHGFSPWDGLERDA